MDEIICIWLLFADADTPYKTNQINYIRNVFQLLYNEKNALKVYVAGVSQCN